MVLFFGFMCPVMTNVFRQLSWFYDTRLNSPLIGFLQVKKPAITSVQFKFFTFPLSAVKEPSTNSESHEYIALPNDQLIFYNYDSNYDKCPLDGDSWTHEFMCKPTIFLKSSLAVTHTLTHTMVQYKAMQVQA